MHLDIPKLTPTKTIRKIHAAFFALLSILFVAQAYARANSPVLIEGTKQKATRIYNTPPNISSLIYHDFCQDMTGQIWIATESGLMKFDGSNHELFRNDKNRQGSISDNRVNRVFCDSHGNIWAGTANGLNFFNPTSENFEVVKLPPSENLDGFIQDIAEQKDGTIIFNVAGNGLYLVDPGAKNKEATRITTNGNCFEGNSIFINNIDGSIIMGTHSGAIHVVKANGNFKEYPLSDNYILGICPENGENALVFGPSDIWRIDLRSMRFLPIDVSAIRHTTITKLCSGKDKTIYIATNHGLWLLEPGSDKVTRCDHYFNSSIDIDKAKIGAVYMAPDGNLWAGCNYQGAIMAPMTPFPFNYYPLNADISDFKGGITALTSGNHGTWLSVEDGDIINISADNKLVKRINVPTSGDVKVLFNDNDKAIYAITTEGNMWEINPVSGTVARLTDLNKYAVSFHINKIPDSPVIYISIIGHGLVKFDTESGLKTELKSGSPNAKNLYSDWISSTFLDSKNRLWLGLYSGLSCYDIKSSSFKEINQEPFMKMAVNAFNETPDGKILLGTSDGILIYNPEKDKIEKALTSVDGLADNDVRTIQTDNDGIAWIGTMLGLSQYNPSTGTISSIRGGYGLSETTFLRSSFNRSSGEICFAGNLGYTIFRPDAVKSLSMEKPVYISGIFLNGDKLTKVDMVEGEKAIVADPEIGYRHIRLSHNDNNLMIKVSTMDFRDPENVTYEWMEKGADSWIVKEPGNSSIVIPRLSPGNHTILIRASENGVYSPLTEMTIHVTAPWYLTDIAKFLYFLMAVGILALVLILYKKRNLEKLNEAKVKFFMDISHEIRSPITCIIGPLESLLRKDLDPETKTMLNRACRNARRILGLANQLLEIRKIDKGKKTLAMQPTNLKDFTDEIVELYMPMAQGKNIRLHLNVQDDMPDVWIDRTNFDKVLVNLITNAIKYTPENGKIDVKISERDDSEIGDCAEITVTDTGIGIDPKNIDKIFDRFYQSRGSVSGFGVGLDLARQLVILHHGSLTAANRIDGVKGSVFTVRVPVGNSHLSEEEMYIPEPGDNNGTTGIKDTVINSQEENDFAAPIHKSPSSRRILIVDDDSELREYLAIHFSKTAKTFLASDGNEAMKTVLNNPNIDLVISDVVMPVMDGLTFLRTIKSNSDTNHIPVILLSSRGEVADRLAGWDFGADGYIEKPFNIAELDAMTDNLINNRRRMKGKYSGIQKSVESIAAPEIKGNDEILIDRIVKAIESHIDDSGLSVESLSEEIGISRAHLHRRLKQLVGMSPSDYIRNIRVKHACELLKRPDIDVTQVAYSLGFTSQPHFSTSFKRFMGMTPTEYRNLSAMAMTEKEEATAEESLHS